MKFTLPLTLFLLLVSVSHAQVRTPPTSNRTVTTRNYPTRSTSNWGYGNSTSRQLGHQRITTQIQNGRTVTGSTSYYRGGSTTRWSNGAISTSRYGGNTQFDRYQSRSGSVSSTSNGYNTRYSNGFQSTIQQNGNRTINRERR